MINVCNIVFDILSVKFQRNTQLNHNNLAALIMKFDNSKLHNFL